MTDDDGVDDLDLGRPPMSRRTRRRLGAGLVAVVVVAGAAIVSVQVLDRPASPAPVAVSAPGGPPDRGFAGGPVLTEVDGRTELAVPGGAMFGGAAMNVALEPATDALAAVQRVIPSLHDVRGGRVVDPDVHYGVYLQGTYDAVDGSPVTFTLYTARAPETPPEVEVGVVPVVVGDERTVRTDVSVYTGTGWWVHAVAQAHTPDPVSGDQAGVVRAAAVDPVLVS
ncbi:hypothetical protein ACXR2U_22255 [Jatrophihabitans sp. YIM 134969]